MTPSARDGRGKRYRVRWYGADGVRRAASFTTKAAAQRHWHDVMAGRESGQMPAAPDITVRELTSLWLKTKDGLSVRGYEACENAAVHVDRAWGEHLIGDLVASVTWWRRRSLRGSLAWVGRSRAGQRSTSVSVEPWTLPSGIG